MPTHAIARGDDDNMDIPPSLLNGVGVGVLLVILFYALVKEHLVTGPAHRREIASKDEQIRLLGEAHDKRIADKDAQIVMWRAVGETSQAQMTETLEHSRLSVQLLQAIERRAQARDTP
jgi:hypothetical protein